MIPAPPHQPLHSAHSHATPPASLWLARALVIAAVLLLVPHMTRAIVWAHETGKLPVKPRDYTLILLGTCGLLTLLRKPSFCLPAIALLGLPLMRVADAAFLQRFDLSYLGPHSVLVMILFSNFLVSAMAVFVLMADNGKQVAVWIAVASILISTLSIYYEWLGFGSFTRIPGRMSGLTPDPNDAPILCCMMLGILFTLNPKFWWNLSLAALATPAIILTLSRSGAAVFAVLMMAYIAANLRRQFTGLLVISIVALPVLGAGVVFMVSQSANTGIVKDENTEGRMRAIFELDFDKIGSPERAKDLKDGWEAVKAKPLFGHGTGAGSSRWQPHNQVITIWLDLGLPGMLLFVSLLILVTFRSLLTGLRGFYCLIPIWLFIPCSQILLEMPHYFMAFTVAAQAVFPGRLRIRLHHPHPSPHAPPAGLPHS